MAYGVHWQIDFVALLTNDVYKVEILEDGYDGDIVYLYGAENPIETTEDNSDDILTPIRKQTGHLRIADNGYDREGNVFDYTDMLPYNTFDMQVRLWQVGTTNTLRWIGYIKPDTLTSKLFESVSIREFQIVCPLGTLFETHITFSNDKNNIGTVKTLGQIMHTALSLVGVDWINVYKQNNVHHREDLNARISLLNFIRNNEPTHSTPPEGDIDSFTATWYDESTSWGDVLQEICKFWGWTLYSRGYDIYIIAHHQIGLFAQFSFSDLESTDDFHLSDIQEVQVDFDDLSWASTNHTECRKLGYRNIEVDASVNETVVVADPNYDEAEMSYWPVAADLNQIIHFSNAYYYVLRRLGAANDQHNINTQFIENYQIYENRQIQTSTLEVPCVIEYSDGWENEEWKSKTAFNFNKGICCWKGGQSGALTFFMKTLEDVCLPLNSVLCIAASASLSYNPDPDYPSNTNTAGPYDNDGNPKLDGRTITVELKIGDYWWDNNSYMWSTTRSSFNMTVRSDGSIITPINTFEQYGFNPSGILFDDHNGSQGFCIYNNPGANNGNGISGRLKLSIYANTGSPTTYLMNCVLNSLTVSIYNQDSKLKPQNKGSQQYKDVASVNFHNNTSVSLNIASGTKNTYGLGQLYNLNLSLLDTVPFRDYVGEYVNKQPEERLLERMVDMYSTVTIQNIIEIMDNLQASLPMAKMYGYWDDDNVIFYPLSCSHNWREGTMKLTLINK